MTANAAEPASSTPAFNLIDEPWLPVRWAGGSQGEVGLRQLFERSREITGLAEPSAPSFVALHRLLLAITHRALTLQFGWWTDSDRARWYRDGLPQEAFDRYFERWRERFWLFHPTQPFMQVAALAKLPQTQPPKPWTVVSLESAAGNNPVVFDHSVDARPRPVPTAHAWRAAIGFLQFAAGGPVKVLRKDGFGRKGALFDSAAIVPVGSMLQQTLLLALHPAPRSTDETNLDVPTWEREPLDAPDLTSTATLPTGPNDRYTRCTRALLLLPFLGGYVRYAHFSEGLDLLEDENATDPMNSFRQGTEKWVRLRFNEGRSVWRDLPALLPAAAGSAWRPAAVLSWAQNLLDASEAWDDHLPVAVGGMAANQGKMLSARLERFHLPRDLLTAPGCAAALKHELEQSETLYGELRQLAARRAAQALPNAASKEGFRQARDAIDAGPLAATYFAQVEQGLPRLLDALGARQLQTAHDLWQATQLEAARLAWEATGEMLGPSAAALKARALYERAFLSLVHPLRLRSPPTPSAEQPLAPQEETP